MESLKNQKRRGGEEKGRKDRELKEDVDEIKKLKRGVGQVLLLIIPFQVEMGY